MKKIVVFTGAGVSADSGLATFRDADGKTKLCHTLNGSGVALPRLMVALLEQHQNADGSVNVQLIMETLRGGGHYNAAATMLWSRYCPSLRDTGMVSTATGFLDFVSYSAAAAANLIFANAVTDIGWGNLILVWMGLMVIGVIVALPYKWFKKIKNPCGKPQGFFYSYLPILKIIRRKGARNFGLFITTIFIKSTSAILICKKRRKQEKQ